MESSSAVRVMEMNGEVEGNLGTGASEGKRRTVKVIGRRRNLRCMTVISSGKTEPSFARPWTNLRPVPTWSQVVLTAFLTAAFASRRVESSVGSGEESGVIRSGISVQPRTTASQPCSANVRITS